MAGCLALAGCGGSDPEVPPVNGADAGRTDSGDTGHPLDAGRDSVTNPDARSDGASIDGNSFQDGSSPDGTGGDGAADATPDTGTTDATPDRTTDSSPDRGI